MTYEFLLVASEFERFCSAIVEVVEGRNHGFELVDFEFGQLGIRRLGEINFSNQSTLPIQHLEVRCDSLRCTP